MTATRLRLGVLSILLAGCQQTLAPDDADPGAGQPTASLSTAPSAATCSTTPSGVVAWWHADGDGADVMGLSPATPVGAVGYAPGRFGQAFVLDGASYLQVPDNPRLDLADSFTLDFWFEPTTANGWWFQGLVGKRDPVSGVTNFGVNFNESFLGLGPYYNDPTAVGGDDYDQAGSSFEAIREMPTPTPGTFHHFAAVYRQASVDQVELRMFVDGTMVRARTIDGSLVRTVNHQPLTLGASYPGSELFTGLLDEVRIFGRALSDSEVAALASPSPAACGPAPILIDILPGDPDNQLPCHNPRALVTVAVVSTADFDATTLDPGTARFGPGQAVEVHRDRQGNARRHVEDVNGDGLPDLVLHFRLGDTGLDCQAAEAALLIDDPQGQAYQGTDTVSGHP
jgi:Concanavalin A-like lectin/glucanases superfamily